VFFRVLESCGVELFFSCRFFPVDLLGTSVRAADVVSACFLYLCRPCFVPLNACARSVRSPSLDFALLNNNMSERSCRWVLACAANCLVVGFCTSRVGISSCSLLTERINHACKTLWCVFLSITIIILDKGVVQ
jgi:hypothetical protein